MPSPYCASPCSRCALVDVADLTEELREFELVMHEPLPESDAPKGDDLLEAVRVPNTVDAAVVGSLFVTMRRVWQESHKGKLAAGDNVLAAADVDKADESASSFDAAEAVIKRLRAGSEERIVSLWDSMDYPGMGLASLKSLDNMLRVRFPSLSDIEVLILAYVTISHSSTQHGGSVTRR